VAPITGADRRLRVDHPGALMTLAALVLVSVAAPTTDAAWSRTKLTRAVKALVEENRSQAAEIQALEDRVAALESSETVAGLAARVTALERVDAGSRLAGLEARADRDDGRIARLEGLGIQARLTEHSERIAALDGSVGVLQALDIEARLAAHGDDIAALASRADRHNERLRELEAVDVGGRLAAHSEQIATLDARARIATTGGSTGSKESTSINGSLLTTPTSRRSRSGPTATPTGSAASKRSTSTRASPPRATSSRPSTPARIAMTDGSTGSRGSTSTRAHRGHRPARDP
jgi:cell division protein FtsB